MTDRTIAAGNGIPAMDRHEQEAFWQAVHDGFARLRADPVAWRDVLYEAALWDSASGDGLENEEPCFTKEKARGRHDPEPSPWTCHRIRRRR